MGPAVNRDNRELVLCDFALCACELNMNSSYTRPKSLAVDN